VQYSTSIADIVSDFLFSKVRAKAGALFDLPTLCGFREKTVNSTWQKDGRNTFSRWSDLAPIPRKVRKKTTPMEEKEEIFSRRNLFTQAFTCSSLVARSLSLTKTKVFYNGGWR
jgi:hypothetical protein